MQSKQDLITWRRTQALTMYAAGKTMTEIAEVLKVDVSTISRDIAYIRQESKERQSEYIESELPFRHALRVANMDKTVKELWRLYEKEQDSKGKKAILDSITDALIKQAAIDGDPIAIEKALKAVAKMRRMMSLEQEQHPEVIAQ